MEIKKIAINSHGLENWVWKVVLSGNLLSGKRRGAISAWREITFVTFTAFDGTFDQIVLPLVDVAFTTLVGFRYKFFLFVRVRASESTLYFCCSYILGSRLFKSRKQNWILFQISFLDSIFAETEASSNVHGSSGVSTEKRSVEKSGKNVRRQVLQHLQSVQGRSKSARHSSPSFQTCHWWATSVSMHQESLKILWRNGLKHDWIRAAFLLNPSVLKLCIKMHGWANLW